MGLAIVPTGLRCRRKRLTWLGLWSQWGEWWLSPDAARAVLLHDSPHWVRGTTLRTRVDLDASALRLDAEQPA